MTNATRFVFASLLFVLSCGRGHGEPVTAAPASVIASGSSFWVDSQPEPENAIINARVDIGSLQQRGDAIEADTAWRLTLGTLMDIRGMHPGLDIPHGSTLIETQRIICGENGMLSYRVASTILSPDGEPLDRQVFNADEERARAEDRARAFSENFPRLSSLHPYGPNPPSLVCWAAARKCEGEDYRWPPPPNKTPLEHSERATKMRADYNRFFVPHCQLSGSR